MYRRSINIKPKCDQQTGKALSNHESFSPSQSHETVPLTLPRELTGLPADTGSVKYSNTVCARKNCLSCSKVETGGKDSLDHHQLFARHKEVLKKFITIIWQYKKSTVPGVHRHYDVHIAAGGLTEDDSSARKARTSVIL
jgi:hypothetical protein